MISFETENVKSYKLLLWIEVAVRECIRYCMESLHGQSWKRRIPGDLLKKIRESEKEENHPQFNYVRLGPLYYLTLGELIPILRQKVGAGAVDIFGGEWVITDIENILGLRNAICHARPVPSVGLAAIEALHQQIFTALSSHRLEHIVSNPDIGIFPEDTVRSLLPWIDGLKEKILALQSPIAIHHAYETALQQYWWGVPEFSGFDCSLLERLAGLIAEYNALPAGVGSAGGRQRFCDEKQVIQIIEIAAIELKKVST